MPNTFKDMQVYDVFAAAYENGYNTVVCYYPAEEKELEGSRPTRPEVRLTAHTVYEAVHSLWTPPRDSEHIKQTNAALEQASKFIVDIIGGLERLAVSGSKKMVANLAGGSVVDEGGLRSILIALGEFLSVRTPFGRKKNNKDNAEALSALSNLERQLLRGWTKTRRRCGLNRITRRIGKIASLSLSNMNGTYTFDTIVKTTEENFTVEDQNEGNPFLASLHAIIESGVRVEAHHTVTSFISSIRQARNILSAKATVIFEDNIPTRWVVCNYYPLVCILQGGTVCHTDVAMSGAVVREGTESRVFGDVRTQYRAATIKEVEAMQRVTPTLDWPTEVRRVHTIAVGVFTELASLNREVGKEWEEAYATIAHAYKSEGEFGKNVASGAAMILNLFRRYEMLWRYFVQGGITARTIINIYASTQQGVDKWRGVIIERFLIGIDSRELHIEVHDEPDLRIRGTGSTEIRGIFVQAGGILKKVTTINELRQAKYMSSDFLAGLTVFSRRYDVIRNGNVLNDLLVIPKGPPVTTLLLHRAEQRGGRLGLDNETAVDTTDTAEYCIPDLVPASVLDDEDDAQVGPNHRDGDMGTSEVESRNFTSPLVFEGEDIEQLVHTDHGAGGSTTSSERSIGFDQIFTMITK